ncbi:4-(cytidine 5'-diphospho)-2-C-methyl-D-erythritol kinase [Porphyromonadaceae bacterium W3.11]|nr:4-(cytidine 5'-diphospho)-2-C-methyl-D-erythritol kinase [Porphyromonadaceae bacterium W3.11]
MITFPKAKINIGLRVLRKRADGYHDIQTLMYPIPLTDVLEIIPSDIEMKYDFGTLDFEGVPEDNLVTKAYFALKEDYPSLPALEIILRKRIPTGGGLGGGSSDGTNMLLGIKRLFGLEVSSERMHQLATSLGADCPFFLKDEPQLAEGIGEQLELYPLDLRGKWLTLLTSEIHINTASAYASITPSDEGDDLRELLALPIKEWKGKVVNHFESAIFAQHPILADGIKRLYDAGADYASMSGSGPTLYAISDSPLKVAWDGKSYNLQL